MARTLDRVRLKDNLYYRYQAGVASRDLVAPGLTGWIKKVTVNHMTREESNVYVITLDHGHAISADTRIRPEDACDIVLLSHEFEVIGPEDPIVTEVALTPVPQEEEVRAVYTGSTIEWITLDEACSSTNTFADAYLYGAVGSLQVQE